MYSSAFFSVGLQALQFKIYQSLAGRSIHILILYNIDNMPGITFVKFNQNQYKEIPFREDFPCHSTWKRCKHSGHFSRFRNIIGNFCIINKNVM
jgi:hypothetical protein